jgi:hypothetical protein
MGQRRSPTRRERSLHAWLARPRSGGQRKHDRCLRTDKLRKNELWEPGVLPPRMALRALVRGGMDGWGRRRALQRGQHPALSHIQPDADSRRESCGSPRARRRHVEGKAGCREKASDLVVEGSRSGSGFGSAPGMGDASDLPPREAHQSYRPRLVCYCSQTVHIRDWFVWGKRRRR